MEFLNLESNLGESINNYLQSTAYFDFEHPSVQQFVDSATKGLTDSVAIARALYLRVRDDFRYDPYSFRANSKTFQASYVIQNRASYCIPKAVLLGAAARAKGIPSRLGLADVKNHVSDPSLREKLQSDIFAMHGYIELYLEGKWVKATPAFNQELCHKFGVAPLEFNGVDDSIFQAFDASGRDFMVYLNDYGLFDDVPREFIIARLASTYPHLSDLIQSGSWIARS